MEIYQTPEQKKLDLVKEKVKKQKKYYTQLFIYGIGVILYFFKTYLGAPLNFIPLNFLNGLVMWCWTFFIVVQTLKMFFAEKIFNASWENRKINEILEKEEQLKRK